MAEFDPRQLDQLEDALEHLGDHDLEVDHESLELPAELIERLNEYQDVLALCRDAFPLESPPDGLLTGVIAEAREVSRHPRTRDAGQRGAWRRIWERWRGTVVPGFALATTAVVVLWVIEPNAKLESESERSSSKLESPAELERTQPAGKSSEPTERATSIGKSDQPAQPPAVDTQPTPDEEEAKATESLEPKPSAAGKPPKKSKSDDAYDLQPEPAPTPMSKDETWTNLERANTARRAGNCDRARSLYDDVIAASSDALAIGQAKGGIGLCFEQDRLDSEAAKWFDDARSASPGIDAWIKLQRDEQPLPGESKKPISKKSQALDAEAL